MDEVIPCTLLGVASTTMFDVQSNPSGREIWTGVRVRTADGKARFFQSMLVEAEASIILSTAMARGEQVELWLTGKVQRPYPYAIRSATEEWYYDGYPTYLKAQAAKCIVIGILTLPLMGFGLLGILMALGYLTASSTFAPRHSRKTFELGHAGTKNSLTEGALAEKFQAA